MPSLLSVNTARPLPVDYSRQGTTGINKLPVAGPVHVADREYATQAGSALGGDCVVDRRFHGGDHQAVYAFAREDLDRWEGELGRTLNNGVFGENLTTVGLKVNSALIGERWRVGDRVLLEVTSARLPCRVFASWIAEPGWVKRFTLDAQPGAYLRVLEPGEIKAGDPITVVHRPDHEVTVSFLFRALTAEPQLLPHSLNAGSALNPTQEEMIRKRLNLRPANT
ncbi:MOSC domain-containing protein [Streptomyces sp. NPDC057909]|uniref:MOSC domain-containing protein n=1 Tax=Streptomyces sp. NPDC057909 TaxID=3346277 RepID=UPI0036E29F14